jgi:hypothetical protein
MRVVFFKEWSPNCCSLQAEKSRRPKMDAVSLGRVLLGLPVVESNLVCPDRVIGLIGIAVQLDCNVQLIHAA